MVFGQKTVQAYPTLKWFPHMFLWEFSKKILGMLSESLNLSSKLSKEGDSIFRKWSSVAHLLHWHLWSHRL